MHARVLLSQTRYTTCLRCPFLYRTLVGSLPPKLGVEQPLADAGLPELDRHPGPESPVQCGSMTRMAAQTPLGSAGREAPCSLRCRGAKYSSAPFVRGLLQGVVGVRGTSLLPADLVESKVDRCKYRSVVAGGLIVGKVPSACHHFAGDVPVLGSLIDEYEIKHRIRVIVFSVAIRVGPIGID